MADTENSGARRFVATQHGPQPEAELMLKPIDQPFTEEQALALLASYSDTFHRIDAALREIAPDAFPPFGYYAPTVLEDIVLEIRDRLVASDEEDTEQAAASTRPPAGEEESGPLAPAELAAIRAHAGHLVDQPGCPFCPTPTGDQSKHHDGHQEQNPDCVHCAMEAPVPQPSDRVRVKLHDEVGVTATIEGEYVGRERAGWGDEDRLHIRVADLWVDPVGATVEVLPDQPAASTRPPANDPRRRFTVAIVADDQIIDLYRARVYFEPPKAGLDFDPTYNLPEGERREVVEIVRLADPLATHSPDDGHPQRAGTSRPDPDWPPPDDAMADAIGAHLREAWPDPFGSDEVFCEQVSFEASRAVLRHQMAAAVGTELSALIAQRPVTPGRPEDGLYPATLDEVADEVAAWVRQLAPSLPRRVTDRLATTEETPEADPNYEGPNRSRNLPVEYDDGED